MPVRGVLLGAGLLPPGAAGAGRVPCKVTFHMACATGALPSFQNQIGELLHENYHCRKSSRKQSSIKYLYIFMCEVMSEEKFVLQEEWEWSYLVPNGGLAPCFKTV